MERVLSQLYEGAKPIGEIAKRVGIGWKTCEKYLLGLKRIGIATEIRTARGRIFMLSRPTRARLLTVPRVRVGTTFELIDEEPPDPEEVEDLT